MAVSRPADVAGAAFDADADAGADIDVEADAEAESGVAADAGASPAVAHVPTRRSADRPVRTTVLRLKAFALRLFQRSWGWNSGTAGG
ncbi:hypothetical protein GCM10011583_37220 [Streptomyces camponoticapitis]|uniref:Uncharacterized protein n=1 Tax=Streptomyces camponoticapitis TaxID=1616125 RepID=A0ABQ2EA46_9ACTN|nr:hypothetical protein GCM10011583_37220 [Streptomyces camponoticapitis]